MAGGDRARHADLRQRSPLEFRDVERAGIGDEVQLHVEQRRGDELGRREALVEAPRRLQPLDQRLGHRLAGAIVAGETAQRLGPLQPMLEQLRRQLDEVARDVRAGEQRIGDVRQHAVQGVAELVEQACAPRRG